jgi:hypothetical protein
MAVTPDYADRYNEAKDAVWQYADYFELESDVRCRKYITGLTRALSIIPQLVAHGGSGAEELREDKETMFAELQQARKWLTTRKRAGGFRQVQMSRQSERFERG